MKLLFVCRDFSRTHPDMQYQSSGLDEGICGSELDVTNGRRPRWNTDLPPGSHSSLTNERNFNGWWVNGPEVLENKWIYLLSSGKWTFGGPGFFPFDDNNQRSRHERTHNYYFTCEHHGSLVYNASADQTITVTSSDDLWVFINDKLVIDLGGVHEPFTRTIHLDSLGLTNGRSYPLDLFYANRYPPESVLQIVSTACLNCNQSIDRCGVCGGDGTTCIDGDDTETKKEYDDDDDDDSEDDDDDDPQAPPGGHHQPKPKPPCNTEDGDQADCEHPYLFADFQESVDCSVTEVDTKKYKFDFNLELEYPYDVPSGVIIGLSGYNENIRLRGSCDNLLSNPTTSWSDISALWNPDLVTNSPMWTKTSSFINGGTKKKITYSVITSAENLMYCTDPEGVGDLVIRQHDTPSPQQQQHGVSPPPYHAGGNYSYAGMWVVTRTSPENLGNEVLGEDPMYSFVCSFKICENNVGVSAITYSGKQDHSGGGGGSGDDDGDDEEEQPTPKKDVSVTTNWVRTYCNPSSNNLVMILKTCSHLVQSPGWWVKLVNPVLNFHNGTNGVAALVHYNNSFTISPLSDSEDCTLSGDQAWHCCQRWLVVSKPGMLPPLKGSLQIIWDASIYKLDFNQNVISSDNEIQSTQKLCSTMYVNINNQCSGITQIECAEGRCGNNNGNGNFHLKGQIRLFKDSLYTTPWIWGVDEPFKEGDRIYANLIPKLDKITCRLYRISTTEITLKIYPKRYYIAPGGSNVAAAVVGSGSGNNNGGDDFDYGTPCYVTVVYHQGNTALNQLKGSWVIDNADGGVACYSNFSWVAKRVECHSSSRRPHRHASSWNNNNGGDDSVLEGTQEDDFIMLWDSEGNRWVYQNQHQYDRDSDDGEERDEREDKKRGDVAATRKKQPHGDKVVKNNNHHHNHAEDHYTHTVVSVTWELIPLFGNDNNNNDYGRKRTTTSLEMTESKRWVESGGEEEEEERNLRDHDFPKNTQSRVTIQCNKYQRWDEEENVCKVKRLYWWFPGMDYGLLWIIMAFFAVFGFIFIICICCASCFNLSPLLKGERSPSYLDHHHHYAYSKGKPRFYHKWVTLWPFKYFYTTATSYYNSTTDFAKEKNETTTATTTQKHPHNHRNLELNELLDERIMAYGKVDATVAANSLVNNRTHKQQVMLQQETFM